MAQSGMAHRRSVLGAHNYSMFYTFNLLQCQLSFTFVFVQMQKSFD